MPQPNDKMDPIKDIMGEIGNNLDKTIFGAILTSFSNLYTREGLAEIIAKQTGIDPKCILKRMNEATETFWKNY